VWGAASINRNGQDGREADVRMLSKTRVWHPADVRLGSAGLKQEIIPTAFRSDSLAISLSMLS